jgi:threonine aldolase
MSGPEPESEPRRHFASDNNAGAHPEVLAAIARANRGHVPAYGDDPYTEAAIACLRAHFGDRSVPYLVFGGTGANVLSLRAVMESHQAVICADTAHIHQDECGAPERFVGCKLLVLPTPDGKLRPADLERHLVGIGVEHHVQPRVVSISQTTEMGTVYSPAEIRSLAEAAHAHGLLLHVDGARLANAAAALGVTLGALSTEAGVDVLSFGGTKNGLISAEAVIFLNGAGPPEFKYLRKQAMQLASKMRFIAAQFLALLSGDLWHRNASLANAMAQRLARGLAGMPRVRITQPVEANAVFAVIPPEVIPQLQRRYHFYVWNERTFEVRWMTAFDTTEADVDGFLGALRELLG